MAELVGNLLVAQSGGPTAVINASLAGVIQEAGRHEFIEEIYGGADGIFGILNEALLDINEEKAKTIEGLKYTPAAALGTCRYKLAAEDMNRLFEVFQAHNIRYFCYIGGNDSQGTSLRIHEEALRRGYELRMVGIPKTIDNDLPHTDTCPGYGSAIKYAATTVAEIGLDVRSMATDEGSCCLIEVMGRAAGWIAAGTVLAKRGDPLNAPHVILVPELPLDEAKFLAKVKETIDAHRHCVVVVGEGIKDTAGNEIGADPTKKDAFGHFALAGAAYKLKVLVETNLNHKTRIVQLGYAQRAAEHYSSLTDSLNAFACGEAAVKAAVDGQSGVMIKLVRNSQNGSTKWSTAAQALGDVADIEHLIPRDWISEDGFLPNEKFIEYARPLIVGEVKVPTEGGLPKYVALEKVLIEKKLPPRGLGKTEKL